MKEIKLFEILNSITKEELALLGDFAESKVFNSNRNVISLYKYLKVNLAKIKKNGISRERIYKAVFRNEDFNESKYWKLTSAFSSVLEKFLIYTEFEKDIFYRDNLLLENFRKRNLKKQYSILSREVSDKFGKEFNRSMNYFVNRTHFHFQNISYFGYDTADNGVSDIENLFENLTMFFIMTTIVSICIISNFDKKFILKCKTDLWNFNEMLDYLFKNRKRIRKNYPTVYIFFLILYTKLYPEQEEYYIELKNSVLKNASLFTGNFLRHILVNMLDYTVQKLSEGEEKYLKEIVTINKIMSEKNLTFFGEYIQPEYFYSVVEHASELNEHEWIGEFMEKYNIYLRDDFKGTVVNLSKSKIHFTKNEFEESLRNLLNVNNIKPYFYIAQKILLLQNYYELKDTTAIKQVMETLNKYLKRRKDIPEEIEANCTKFLFYFRKILKPGNGHEVCSLTEMLKGEKYFLNKPWLLNKAKSIG
jgi:hypothetical protein